MHYKTNRLNHDFQIVHFIAGGCHTADAAYAILCDLREDRQNALAAFQAGRLREEAKLVRARRKLEDPDEAVRLEGKADLVEAEGFAATTARNHAAALAELATIEACMASLEPQRKFRHLPEAEAHEAAQREEWTLELIWRAENSLLTTGTIAPDQLATMRMHPDFGDVIEPAIQEIRQLLGQPDGARRLMDRVRRPRFEVPRLAPKLTPTG